jgi:stalled ribosome rescue protein Dom34
METNNNLGVWMDHSSALLIDLKSNMNSQCILSQFTSNTKEEALQRSESHMQNKRQQMHELYYKEIGAEILKYNNVLLFGPTNAKVELHNYLNKDLHFKDIKFDIESAGTMTNNQADAFVKNHFDN